MIRWDEISVWGVIVTFVQVLGFVNAAHAVMKVRLSQSAIAWSVFLVAMPWIGIPAYWVLGRRKFNGYTESMLRAQRRFQSTVVHLLESCRPHVADFPEPMRSLQRCADRLAPLPFLSGNGAKLLIDGKETYQSMLESIAAARDYVLFQSYILNDDATGRVFLEALLARARAGVRVFVLYDEVGSRDLTEDWLETAEAAGISCSGFKTTKGRGNRFQLNFRNHRKIIVIDGRVGFTGGLNIGDEQLGKDPELGYWRDTHMKLVGPAVKALQLCFLRDWFWATDDAPAVDWEVEPEPFGDAVVFPLYCGPADEMEVCSLFFGSLIDVAKERLWIATPYFVPDEPTLAALKTAALRGVDVKIIVPAKPDHFFVGLCAVSYYAELKNVGVRLFAYTKGFMHQKVVLVDDHVAGVGTINLDNRSFHLNFEDMAFVSGPSFVAEVEEMFLRDLGNCLRVDLDEYSRRKLPYRVAVRLTRLMAVLL